MFFEESKVLFKKIISFSYQISGDLIEVLAAVSKTLHHCVGLLTSVIYRMLLLCENDVFFFVSYPKFIEWSIIFVCEKNLLDD